MFEIVNFAGRIYLTLRYLPVKRQDTTALELIEDSARLISDGLSVFSTASPWVRLGYLSVVHAEPPIQSVHVSGKGERD